VTAPSGSVAFRERARVAKHEAVHVAASYILGQLPAEVRIMPPRKGIGRIEGECSAHARADLRIHAVVLGAGVRDGHGADLDREELERRCPDPDERDAVLALVDEVMEHAEFRRVRDAVARKLMFRDRIAGPELRRIIEKAAASA